MLPALTTRPKQAVRQVQGLTDDSIDAYANTPLGSGNGGENFYNDNGEGDVGISRASPPATSRSASTHQNSARTMTMKKVDCEDSSGAVARVVRDRKASGEEDLSLKTGDVVRVLSSKRTGYLKCEFADQTGYVPSSYLEFLDESTGDGGAPARDGGNDTETPRSDKKKKKKKKDKERDREKRGKEKNSDAEEVADTTTSSRSLTKVTPRAAVEESVGGDSPRKSKKKHRKHRRDDEDDLQDEAPATSRRAEKEVPDDAEKAKRSSRRREKKRRGRYSSESSESDDEGGSKSRRGKKSRRHRHRRSDSDSYSSPSEDSDASHRRRRRRRHRRVSSEDEDEESDQKRRSPRRSRKNRHRGGSDDSEPEVNGAKSARKSNRKEAAESATLSTVGSVSDKKQAAEAHLKDAEKAISRLDVQDKSRSAGKGSQRSEEISDHVNEGHNSSYHGANTAAGGTTATGRSGNKDASDRGNYDTSSRSKSKDSARKDDESRTESSVAAQKGGKTTFGKQIGDKMRSFLGGGKKTERSTKSSSGILNACPGTVQGEEGWYEHGENERYYFILVEGKWSLLYGPMTEDDFEAYSGKVSEQSRMVELPPTYLHKSGYYLNRELRVQRA